MNYCGRISKATVVRNLDDIRRKNLTGSFVSISRTTHIDHDSYFPDIPNALLYARLDKAAAVMMKLPRRWQYAINVADSFISVFAIDAKKEDFTAWVQKNHYKYTDEAEFIQWKDKPGGFWTHNITTVISGVRVQAHSLT